ncbi:hypothetical protein Cflav_PD6097 [Pedosphaera parvula Ellin514]|uniref:Uncharacterized protein n=1 Tax=Pedosphaera parvula (strain Ellin514) TaxID=320771 RepID=B9XAC1_PEDPL|nr:hypothetical protein Cflav_PD6097 [Pedosphaera parvula Ellin514]
MKTLKEMKFKRKLNSLNHGTKLHQTIYGMPTTR